MTLQHKAPDRVALSSRTTTLMNYQRVVAAERYPRHEGLARPPRLESLLRRRRIR